MIDCFLRKTDVDVLYDLAVFYDMESEKEPRFKKKSIRLYKWLARRGHIDSQFVCVLMYALGDGVRKSERKERYWLERAAKQGHDEAQYMFGTLLMINKKTREAGAGWIKKAAEQGHEAAMAKMAFCYAWAFGTDYDIKQSVALYRRLAEMNNVDGFYGLGRAYQYGNGVDADRSEAERLYRLAIDRGDKRAALQLENMLKPSVDGNFTER